MNKKNIITLFFIISILISIGSVSANNMTEDVNALSAMDSDDLSIVEDTEFILNAGGDDSSFSSLNATVNSGNDEIEITNDYLFNDESDWDFVEGINIARNNLVINGNNHTIDANGNAIIFMITGSNIIINDLILRNANYYSIANCGDLTTSNVEFNNGNSQASALYMADSQYTSENDRFVNNNGSAIYAYDSSITINNGYFENNTANRGSAINGDNINLILNNSLLKNSINNWSFVYTEDSAVNVINTTFANSTSKYATAIYNEEGTTNIIESRFVNLFANRTAGALAFKANNNVTIEDCEFINCSSAKNGGAIFIDIPATSDENQGIISIVNTLFEECSSEFGGAHLQLGGALSIDSCDFTRNNAEYNGGAIYLSNASATIENSVFTGNNVNLDYEGDSYGLGGAVFIDNTALNLFDSEFNNNSASEGSAAYMYGSSYSLDNLELNGNNNALYSIFDVESYISNLKGNDSVEDDDFNNTRYYSVVRGPGMQISPLNNSVNISSLPDRYDLREENLVTPVKNQGAMGACWAFGGIASVESALLKVMNYTADLSENNMQNSMLRFSKFGSNEYTEGGTDINTMGYLLSWFGAFPKDYDDYDELGKISPLIMTDEDIHIQDIIIINHTPGDKDSIDNVKKAILEYGGLAGSILSKEREDNGTQTDYYNENTSAEYNPNLSESNHVICVVGWDDNFSASNFLITPPGDGAWIVKNSWGTGWGDEGYFYASYYDKTLSSDPNSISESFLAFVFENTLPYNNNYQYDFSGMLGEFSKADTESIYMNTYEAYEDDVIAAVGTYFDSEGVEYTIDIAVNGNNVYTQSGSSPYYGYHTIKLDKYISIKEGDNFSAAITSDAIPLCSGSRTYYKKGSSLGYQEDWEDLTESGYVACIKVYTLADDSIMIPISNASEEYDSGSYFSVKVVTADGHPVINAIVEFSIGDETYEVKTNTDGIAIFEIPMLEPGNYTLTVTYNSQTFNVTVKVTADDDDNGTQPQIKPANTLNSNIELHRSGNPILMLILSALAIVSLGLKRRDL